MFCFMLLVFLYISCCCMCFGVTIFGYTTHITVLGLGCMRARKKTTRNIKIIIMKLGVSENVVLRRIFEPMKDEVTGEWRRLHNEELNDLYCSPNIMRVIKSRRMRWAGHVARMGEERGRIGFWWENRREGDHWGDLGLDGWIILGWISRRWDVGIWTGLGWPRIERGGGGLWVR